MTEHASNRLQCDAAALCSLSDGNDNRGAKLSALVTLVILLI